MELSPGEHQVYDATFVVDGEVWPFSGSAITFPYSAKAEYRQLLNGESLRVTNRSNDTLRRTIKKPQQVHVNFQNITHEWLTRLKGLLDHNVTFEVQLLAFDARNDTGVPVQSTLEPLRTIDPPSRIFTTFATITGATLEVGRGYSYYVTAVMGGKETRPSMPVNTILPAAIVQPATWNTLNPVWDASNFNALGLQWRHIAGVSAYKVYGRVPPQKLWLVTVDASIASPNQLVGWNDTSMVIPPAGDPDVANTVTYMIPGERRILDDVKFLDVQVNGVTKDFTLIDHNGTTEGVNANIVVDSRNGTISFTSSARPGLFEEVRMKYVWSPRVVIDEIESGNQPWSRIQGSFGVLYNPSITLSVRA